MNWKEKLFWTVGVVVAWALLNRAASFFEVSPGLSFFFPAAAITVLAGLRLRWLGVAAVIVASLITPWGASRGLSGAVLFSLPAGAWAAVLAIMGVPSGTSWSRVWRMVVMGLAGGAILSSLLGGGLLSLLLGPPEWSGFAANVAVWWVPDFLAALVFGLPLLAFFVPEALMDEAERETWRQWRLVPAHWAELVVVSAAVVAGALMLVAFTGGSVHWFVAIFLLPVILAALRGGIGAGLVANGVVSLGYLGLVLASWARGDVSLGEALPATYANLLLLASFTVLAGVQAGRERHLRERVRQQAEEMGRGLEATVRALAAAIEAKDFRTDQHVQRVVRLAVLIGRELGLDDEAITDLRRAAILHDVGKIGIPEEILNKNGALDPDEVEVMQRHVDLGLVILEPVEFLQPVLELVRYHQERWDGDRTGRFPGYFGLRGEEIPLGSRIIAVADAYDAMTHDRPYRRAVSREEAVAELWRCAGSQFDPAVVAAATRVLAEGWDLSGDDLEARVQLQM